MRLPTQADKPSTLTALLIDAARSYPDCAFLIDGATNRHVTFAEAAQSVWALQHVLSVLGVRPGDRVGVQFYNGVEWPLLWLAVTSQGSVVVPINVSYGPADLAHILSDAQMTAVVTSAEAVPTWETLLSHTAEKITLATVDDLFDVDASTPSQQPLVGAASKVPAGANLDSLGVIDAVTSSTLANLQYTSGTSGLPKACMLTHEYWCGVGAAMAAAYALSPEDRVLTAQPFSYVDPQWKTAMCLMTGAALIILPRFSASTFWQDARKHRATVLYVLGSMPQLLFKQAPAPDDIDHQVRLVLCSAIPVALHRDLESRWGVPWREVYGLTESGLNVLAPVDDEKSVGRGLLGIPAPGWRVRIVGKNGSDVVVGTPGELLVSGPTLMIGYWNRPDATAAALRNGWFYTGDLCVADQDEWLRLVGRLKDSIRRGGENIAAAEIEALLCELPEVQDAAVVAEADNVFGEEVKAHVQAVDAKLTVTGARELISGLELYARARLAPYKVPRYFEVWRSLPRTPSERIAKSQIAHHPLRERVLAIDLGRRGDRGATR